MFGIYITSIFLTSYLSQISFRHISVISYAYLDILWVYTCPKYLRLIQNISRAYLRNNPGLSHAFLSNICQANLVHVSGISGKYLRPIGLLRTYILGIYYWFAIQKCHYKLNKTQSTTDS